MTQDDNMKGVLFKNDKQGNENRPDYKGKITIDGVEHWLSAWINTAKSGQKYMALKAEKKDGQQQKQPEQQGETYENGIRQDSHQDMDDSIPF